MPQRRSAKKDLRKNTKSREKNLKVKTQLKTTIKQFKKSMAEKKQPISEKDLARVYKLIDRAASKNIIHRNKAAHKKSSLAKLLNKINVKESS